MIAEFLAGLAAQKITAKKDVTKPKQTYAFNFDSIASQVDTMGASFAPKAASPIDVETYGNQNSNKINQDIIPNYIGDGVRFDNYNSSDLADANGVIIDNPVSSKKTARNLLYQGFDVVTGE